MSNDSKKPTGRRTFGKKEFLEADREIEEQRFIARMEKRIAEHRKDPELRKYMDQIERAVENAPPEIKLELDQLLRGETRSSIATLDQPASNVIQVDFSQAPFPVASDDAGFADQMAPQLRTGTRNSASRANQTGDPGWWPVTLPMVALWLDTFGCHSIHVTWRGRYLPPEEDITAVQLFVDGVEVAVVDFRMQDNTRLVVNFEAIAGSAGKNIPVTKFDSAFDEDGTVLLSIETQKND